MMADDIQHISDTALWIAGYRALETERPDAAFHDPLAKKLAGVRGQEMVKTTGHTNAMAFAMTVRTVAIDRLVEMAVSRGVDTVINLGAGLDTRPYRMKLPRDLRWVEVDFDHLIQYKEKLLAGDQPVCKLERIAVDLSDDTKRQQLFARLGAGTQKALIITEGVIGYLTAEQASQLAKDLLAVPSFTWWIHDFRRGKLQKNRYMRAIKKKLKHTPLRFDIPDPLRFFAELGWKVAETLFILDEADRIGRKFPSMFPWNILMPLLGKKVREMGNRTYGYVMYSRS